MKTEDPDYFVDESIGIIGIDTSSTEENDYSIQLDPNSNEFVSVASYNSSLYADTREDESIIKEADSGRKDV